VGGFWLPVIMPVPAVAAAGESLTASAPLPAAYVYIPEQHVDTSGEKQFEREKLEPWKNNVQCEKDKDREGEMWRIIS